MFKTKPSMIATAVIFSLGLSACGGSSSSSDSDTPDVVTNTAPTAVALSSSTVEENNVAATIGSLTATDADSDDTFTFSVSDDRFEVVDGELTLVADTALDFEKETAIALDVTVTDSANNSFVQALEITVTDSAGVQSVLDNTTVPSTYSFTSQFSSDSSVSHSGQTARQILILELNNYIGSGLAADILDGTITSGTEAKTKLMRLYAATETQWDEDADDLLTFTTTPGAKQTTLRSISSSFKNLQAKVAGNDVTGQHKDWDSELVGWNEKGSITPDELVQELFDSLAANAQTEIDGTVRTNDANGAGIVELYIQADGTDLKQLVQKFLLGALNFSQGTDDYLDNTVDGKGLLSDNISQDDGTKAYTALEHQFDEGFGYFGAAFDYNSYTDAEINDPGYKDSDSDGVIDFNNEFNFSNSSNAAKRDLGTADNTNPTDFTNEAFTAFLTGRAIINDAASNALTDDQMTTLLEQRDSAVLTWEKAISATIVHYVNDVKADLAKLGTDDYSAEDFADLAKHWSELKGFSLNLQFNPHSPMTEEQFATMQEKIGMSPVLTSEAATTYSATLDEVNAMLQEVYNFDAENVANW